MIVAESRTQAVDAAETVEIDYEPLDAVIAMYAWHGRHHVGHITSLRARSGW